MLPLSEKKTVRGVLDKIHSMTDWKKSIYRSEITEISKTWKENSADIF